MVKFVGSNIFIGFNGNLFPVSWNVLELNPTYMGPLLRLRFLSLQVHFSGNYQEDRFSVKDIFILLNFPEDILSSPERDAFYDLEESGFLKTQREELTLPKGKLYWCILSWDGHEQHHDKNNFKRFEFVFVSSLSF